MTEMDKKLHKMTTILKKVAKTLPLYVLFLIPSLIVGLLIWTLFIDGKLYYCSDKVPILDFIPPFVHGSQYGDYWIADPKIVWAIWILLTGLMLMVPYFLAKGFLKERNSLKVLKTPNT